MSGELSLIIAATIGFTHAFEADHLVAVSNIVSHRNQSHLAMKDGMFWGLGHSSTILLIGIVVILGKAVIPETVFTYLEAVVGSMLIALGLWRLYQIRNKRGEGGVEADTSNRHGMAYGVGLVHGLAGSGTLILLVLAHTNDIWLSLLYLLIFGLGSTLGMLMAAGALSLPFSKRLLTKPRLQLSLVVLSSALCIAYGGYVVLGNI